MQLTCINVIKFVHLIEVIVIMYVPCNYRMVGNFRGSNVSWFGELRSFRGFIFS